MDTLDRFLSKEFGIYFVLILFALAFLFLGIDFFSNFWNSQMNLMETLRLYTYKLPGALELFVPVATLLALLLVLSNMSRQNEILALYAGGIGRTRILSAFVAMVSLISTVSFLTFDTLSPMFARKQLALTNGSDPNQDTPISFEQGRFWYRNDNVLFNVGKFDNQTNSLEDVNVYILGNYSRIIQRIGAKTAHYENSDWVLKNGYVVTYPTDTHFPLSYFFETKTGVISQPPKEFQKFTVLQETMELKDLRSYIEKNKTYGLDTTQQEVSYHERLAYIFTPLIFVLISIPFGTRPLKTHGLAQSVGLSFLMVFIYLVLFRFSLSLGKAGYIPPIVAGWLTNIVFLIGAVALLNRKPA